MKNIFQLIIRAAIVIPLLIGCGAQSKKHGKALDKNLTKTGEKLKDADAEAKAKAKADWLAFKNESERSITAMENQANALKAKIDKADEKTKAQLSTEIDRLDQKVHVQKAKLNQRNADFETDLKNFNDTVVRKNEVFKKEFKHDINELGTAFKNLFKDNVK